MHTNLRQIAVLVLGFGLSALLPGCADETPPCPGLPDDIPADWGVIPPGLDTDSWDADIRERMRRACIPALSVSIVRPEGVVMSAAWGYADVVEQLPVTIDTPFMLASTSKAVDALALIAARDDGLLEFDEPVSDLVGFTVRNQRTGGGPTIRLNHLATHSSGIQDNWDVLDPSCQPGDPEEALGDFMAAYLQPDGSHFSRRNNFHIWPAGREWMYSNVGAALAAYALENRADVPFDTYCEDRLFGPLSLNNTGWFLRDFEDPALIARPHEIRATGWFVREHYGYSTWPDGQLRTTPTELAQLLRLAMNDGEIDGQRLLEPGVRETLTTPPVGGLDDWYIRPYVGEQYFFWFGIQFEDRWIVGHDGDDFGVSSEMFFDPQTDVGVVLITNIADNEQDGAVRGETWPIQAMLFDLGEGL